MSKSLPKYFCVILMLCSFLNDAFSHANLKPLINSHYCFDISSNEYLDIVNSLIDHINGDIVLDDADFEDNHDLLVQHMSVLSTDTESISKSFELLALFEEINGALFTTTNTQNGFNRQYASDGLNLHRNIILIHQGLIDYTFTNEMLENNSELLNGKLFGTAYYFPGFVDVPEDPGVVENATVKCSYQLASGSQPWGEIGNPNVIRPTGCYLAPGSIAKVIVPQTLIGKGVKIRVGAHYWNLENKSRYKRLDRVSITYDVNDTMTNIANPLGGGIYLEIPLGLDEGLLDISFENVVRSPFYSKKTFHETSLSDWLDVERKHKAPWADFETDKFMMQVPTSWIYEFEDPKTLLEDWDKSMDAVSDLLGRPRIADRHKNYLQFDVIIRGSAYHPGYPMSNTPYNPNASTNGLPDHNIMRGPQFNQDIHFHELGHEVAITKFAGETEALVNFLYVPVLNKCFGYSLDEAFQKSFGPSYNYTSTKDNTTRTRLVAETFHDGIPRNTCSCTKNEVRYQHRGYAHYVDIVELYGWEALENFWQSESDAADMGVPFPVNNQPQDDRIFRMSKAAGVDLRPLFHFWGIHPDEPEELAQRMTENGLALPMDIKQKLHQYRDLIPANYDEFVAFGNELYPDFLNYSGTQFDFGAGWYQMTAVNYDETRASEIEQALSDIIMLYYGSDCFEEEEFQTPEFILDTQYCKSNEVSPLPLLSDNGVVGNWTPEEINTSEVGVFEYTFSPNLDECAVEKSILIDVYEITANIIGEENICKGESTTLSVDGSFETYSWSQDGLIISDADSLEISQGGLISLVVIDADGCQTETEILISESEVIDISIDVTPPLCFSDYGSAVFLPSGGAEVDYIYSIVGDSLLAGTYTLIVTDEYGCTESFDFEVVAPDPILIELVENEMLISGGVEPYDITIDTIDNIQFVTIIDSNGCEASNEFIITGVNEEIQKMVTVYPIPATEKLYLDISNVTSKIESIELVSINGQSNRKYSKNENVLDISLVRSGVYVLRMLFEDGLWVNKRVLVL